MASLTLDTGALIAADRGDARFWTFWTASVDHVKRIPAPAVAQAWRGARNARMARVIGSCFVVPLDDEMAHDVGELCGQARTSDVVDATVALVAHRFGDDVVTGDAGDLRVLLAALGSASLIRDLRSL